MGFFDFMKRKQETKREGAETSEAALQHVQEGGSQEWQGSALSYVLGPKEGFQSERLHLLGDRRLRHFWCDLRVTRTESGKYAGQPHILVLVDGIQVGEIKAQFRHKCEELFDAVALYGIDRGTVRLGGGEFENVPYAELTIGEHRYMPKRA